MTLPKAPIDNARDLLKEAAPSEVSPLAALGAAAFAAGAAVLMAGAVILGPGVNLAEPQGAAVQGVVASEG